MKQLIATVVLAVAIAGTPTPAIAQDGWTTMLLPGGVSAARTVLDLRADADQVDEFLLADFTRRFYRTGDTASEVEIFRRYVTFLDQVTSAAASWPKGLSRPNDATPRADRERARRFIELLGLTLGSGSTVSAGKSTDARERQKWLLAAGVNTQEMLGPLNAGVAVAVTIPQGELPLPLPAFWKMIDAGRSPLLTIAGSRQSALFYTGLLSLDPETLKYLESHPALSSELRSRYAAAFSATARSIQIKDGTVVPAGGNAHSAMWERLAGARLSSPEAFVPALVSTDEGRLAHFFDMVAQLDPARREWLLGGDGAGAYGVIRRAVSTSDPLTVVRELDVTSSDSQSVLSWIFAHQDETSARVAACRAAQRLAPAANCASAPNMPALLDAALHTPALLTLFERLGVTDPEVVTATVRAARQFDDDGKGDDLRPLAQWQLMLALIEQVAVRQQWDAAKVTPLLQGWAGAASAPGSDADGRAGQWLVDVLLPALAGDVKIDDLEVYERDVIVALAKRAHNTTSPVKVFWEGIEYIVDDTFATTRDVLTIRVSQHSPTLGDVVRLRGLLRTLEAGISSLSQVAEISADVTRVTAATAKLRARDGSEQKIAGEFRKVDKIIRDISNDRDIGDATAQIPRVREALDALLEGTLLPLVYAMAVSPSGAAPSTLLDMPHWHTWEKAAWQPARRRIGAFMESEITGSVIGLDIAMADSRLRAVGRAAPPSEKTAVEDLDRRTPVLRAMRAHSETSSWVADAPRMLKAMTAGSAVIAASGAIDAATEARMRVAGIAPERIGAVRWQRERGVPPDRQAFTRLDAYRLGTNDPLPTGWSESDPVVEITLRLLEGTQALRLPAGLVPALLPLATHDWLVQSRLATRDRVEAYMLGLVSARLLVRPARNQHP